MVNPLSPLLDLPQVPALHCAARCRHVLLVALPTLVDPLVVSTVDFTVIRAHLLHYNTQDDPPPEATFKYSFLDNEEGANKHLAMRSRNDHDKTLPPFRGVCHITPPCLGENRPKLLPGHVLCSRVIR